METKRIDLPRGWFALITDREWLSERQAREISRAMVDSIAVASKLNKGGFKDDDPDTYEAFSVLSEMEKHNLSAFQSVLVTQFVTQIDMDGDVLTAPLTLDIVESLPQAVFNSLAKACLEEWTPKDDSPLDPKALTGDSLS